MVLSYYYAYYKVTDAQLAKIKMMVVKGKIGKGDKRDITRDERRIATLQSKSLLKSSDVKSDTGTQKNNKKAQTKKTSPKDDNDDDDDDDDESDDDGDTGEVPARTVIEEPHLFGTP